MKNLIERLDNELIEEEYIDDYYVKLISKEKSVFEKFYQIASKRILRIVEYFKPI